MFNSQLKPIAIADKPDKSLVVIKAVFINSDQGNILFISNRQRITFHINELHFIEKHMVIHPCLPGVAIFENSPALPKLWVEENILSRYSFGNRGTSFNVNESTILGNKFCRIK